MADYSKMTTDEFDENLKDILEEDVSTGELLSIPGIYEILSEHYNNETLERWAQSRPDYESEENNQAEADMRADRVTSS